jgi:hypothetical protein
MVALELTINLSGNFAGALEKGNKALDDTEKSAEHAAKGLEHLEGELGKVSAGAQSHSKHAAKGLELFEGELGKLSAGAQSHSKHAAKGLELFEGELGKLNAGALSLNFSAFQEGGHFLQFDLAEGAKLAYEAIEKVVDKVIELGVEMIKAAAGAQDLNLAINLDVGEEGEKQVDELAESFRQSRFSPKVIKQALLPILEESGDEHADQWDDLVTAATDVATRRNTGVGGAQSALDALRSIEIQPQKIRGSLKELGIKQVDFYSDLGDLLGISAKSAEAQVKAGKVKAQTLLSVALHQIAEREGGALGNATNRGSQTLGTSLQRLSDLKDNLFERLADSKGMKAIEGVIDHFVDVMSGDAGNQFLQGADEALQKVAGWIKDITSPEGISKIKSGLDDAVFVLKEAVNIAEEFAIIWTGNKLIGGVQAFAAVLSSGGIMGGLTAMRTGLNAALSPVAALSIAFEAWRYAFEKIGETVKELGGLKQVGQDLKDWVGGNNSSGIAYENHVTDSSPQWKKDRVAGKQAAGGVEIPLMADGGIVSRPTLAIIGEAGPEAVVPLGRSFGSLPDALGGGGGSLGAPTITYAPQFVFSGGGGRDVREQIESFEQQHRAALQQFVTEVRAAVGAGA